MRMHGQHYILANCEVMMRTATTPLCESRPHNPTRLGCVDYGDGRLVRRATGWGKVVYGLLWVRAQAKDRLHFTIGGARLALLHVCVCVCVCSGPLASGGTANHNRCSESVS